MILNVRQASRGQYRAPKAALALYNLICFPFEFQKEAADQSSCCFFHASQGPGEHGRQHHPAVLQRGHLHPGHRQRGRLPARHPVRDLRGFGSAAMVRSQPSQGWSAAVCEAAAPACGGGGGEAWWALLPPPLLLSHLLALHIFQDTGEAAPRSVPAKAKVTFDLLLSPFRSADLVDGLLAHRMALLLKIISTFMFLGCGATRQLLQDTV